MLGRKEEKKEETGQEELEEQRSIFLSVTACHCSYCDAVSRLELEAEDNSQRISFGAA